MFGEDETMKQKWLTFYTIIVILDNYFFNG